MKNLLLFKSWLNFFFSFPLTVEVIEDDRVQILQSLTSAEAEVRHNFVNNYCEMGWFFVQTNKKTDTSMAFLPFLFQGRLFKQVVLTIYVCGNIVFLIAFLAAINHIWNKSLRILWWNIVQLKNLQGMLSITTFPSTPPWRCNWRIIAHVHHAWC